MHQVTHWRFWEIFRLGQRCVASIWCTDSILGHKVNMVLIVNSISF